MKNIKWIYQLRTIIKRETPDIVISFLITQNIRLLFSSIGLNVKKIISVRNDPRTEFGNYGIKKAIINAIYNKADGIVFQTQDEQSYFSKTIQRKSCVIINPIDDSFYKIERNNLQKNIITIGRLAIQKNHTLLLNAFLRIKDDFPDYNLFIYGEGEERCALEQYITNLKIDDRVFMPGRINNVQEILSHATLFILSSDYEGLPNALMEAMAAGVPVISTDCAGGGPRTLLKEGVNGFLVKCGDVDSLANRIHYLLGHPEVMTSIGKNAAERAQDFRKEIICDNWVQFFYRILG